MAEQHQSLLPPEENKFHVGNGDDGKHYWLTPPDLYARLGAGAKVENLGDVRWMATEDGSQGKGTGRHIAAFILEPDAIADAPALPLLEDAA